MPSRLWGGPARAEPSDAAMSRISRFFKGGGSTASKGRGGPSPQEALARLRETEEMLSKKQEYLESRIERELSLARQHGTKNKRGEPRVWPGEPRVNLSVVT